MEPFINNLGISAVALGGGAHYLPKRSELQGGGKAIENERNRERMLEYERGGSLPTVLNHYLDQHLLFLDYGGATRCNLCLEAIEGNSKGSPVHNASPQARVRGRVRCTIEGNSSRYNCRQNCNINLHKACALYVNKPSNMMEKTSLQTFAHEYPSSIVAATSSSTCIHCGHQKYGYYCSHCDKRFHSIGAMHPTTLLPSLHPEHELEVKTLPRLQNCTVYHHKEDLNARAYCSEKLGSFVQYPGSVLNVQNRHQPLHADHLSIFPEVRNTAYRYCRLNCQCQSCLCSFRNVNFHEESLGNYSNDNKSKDVDYLKDTGLLFKYGLKSGFKKGIKEAFKEDMKERFEDESPMEVLGDFFQDLFS